MNSLVLSMRAAPEEGEALPSPFRSVTALGSLHRRGQVSLVAGASGGGKAQALDSIVPTPAGWSRFGDLRIGDQVIGHDGRPVDVVAITPVWRDEPCYRVEFTDGESGVFSGNHLWAVRTRLSHGFVEEVRTTESMLDVHDARNGRRFSVEMHAPLDLPRADLLIPPYTLGAWLGDGRCDSPQITKPDEQVFAEIANDGYSVGARRSGDVRTIHGLRKHLVELNLLHNKHIPAAYLRGSVEQRLALLQGLMDTDGHCDPSDGRCEFSTTTEALYEGITEVLSSLGIKFGVSRTIGKLYGIAKKPVWRVGFTTTLPVFRLARKRDNLPGAVQERYSRRYVSRIERVDSVPVRCITVSAEDGLYLTGRKMVTTHNSAYATHLAVHGAYTDVDPIPTLYFSADTDKVTLGTRVAAGILGKTLHETEVLLRANDKTTWGILDEATRHVWFSFSAAPSLDDIEQEVQAFAYANGDWPHLVVIDNLINIDHPGEGHTQKDEVMHWLQQLSNQANCHTLVLHHVTGIYEDGDRPIPKSGLLDKVAKRPRLVLTLWKPMQGILRVCPVKNSSGPADSSGNYGADIAWLPDRSFFGE